MRTINKLTAFINTAQNVVDVLLDLDKIDDATRLSREVQRIKNIQQGLIDEELKGIEKASYDFLDDERSQHDE